MRRLTLAFIALLVAWVAFEHIAAAVNPATYLVRDSLLLAIIAALFFAAQFRTPSAPTQDQLQQRSLLLPALLFLLACSLRFWKLASLPSDCIGEECTRALQLAGEGGSMRAGIGLSDWLATAFYQFSNDSLFSLRLAGGFVGSLSVMAFYGMARQVVSPQGALLGTLLLAISPWHLWLSRSADPANGLILGILLCLWALLALCQRPTIWRWLGLGLAMIPAAVEWLSFDSSMLQQSVGNAGNKLSTLIQALLQAMPNDLATPFATLPLLVPIVSALALCGLFASLLQVRRLPFALILATTLILGIAIWSKFVPLALFLPVIFLLATIAIEQLVLLLMRTWLPLIQPTPLFASALLLCFLVAGRGATALLTQLDSLRTTEASAVFSEIARYLVDQRQLEPGTIFFTPPALRFDPAARLLLGNVLQSENIRAIDPSGLPYRAPASGAPASGAPASSSPTSGDLVFLVPMDESSVLTLLQRIYPLAEIAPQLNSEGNISFSALRLSADAQTVPQPLPATGLTATYFSGEQTQGIALAQRIDPLPGYPADFPPPYSVVWRGQLAAIRSGEYLLSVLAEGRVNLSVDGVPLIVPRSESEIAEAPALATLHEGVRYLERGWHWIELSYVPATPFAPLHLYWQPPGSSAAPLSSNFLYPALDVATQPPLPQGINAPLEDERLGSIDSFALTTDVDRWHVLPQSSLTNLPPLVAQIAWQAGSSCGSAEGQLDRPHGATIDIGSGRILVADTANRRIVAYSLAGVPQEHYSDPAWQEPVDVAVEPTGTWLMLDALGNGIFRINPVSGVSTPLALDTSFYHPRGLSVDSDGTILVADTGGARVVALNSEGRMVGEFGGMDKALGKGQPVDAAALHGRWWAISAENGRVWNLATLGSLGALAYNNTQDGPQMAVLPDGSFFASDPGQRAVFYFDALGQPIRQLGGQNALPTGMAAATIEGQSYLAVVDTAACSLTLWRVLEL